MNYKNITQRNVKAVILGMGINGLAIARSLGKNGVEVSGVYVHDYELGRFSRYCKSIRFPSLKNGEDEFLRKLIENLGSCREKPVLFSDSDLYIMFISRNRDQLQNYFRFLLPDHKLLETIVNKESSVDYVTEKGLCVPETYFLGKKNNIQQILDSVEYPCLMKPIDSFSTSFKGKTMRFSDKGLLEAFLHERPELIDKVIIQRIIPGGDSNIYQATTYVSKDGNISPIFTMRKIRQCPPDFGITSYGISENVPQIREIIQKLLTSIQYRGFISVEFKQHPQTGEWFYIESNPRLPYYHALIYDSGINYPYIYYQDMLGLKSEIMLPLHQKNGVRWIYFSSDLESCIKKLSKRQIKISHWLVSVMQSRSFALLDRDDLRPFFYSYIHLLKLFLRKYFKKYIKDCCSNVFSLSKERKAS